MITLAAGNFTNMIVADLAMAVACALLSVFVVLRHWSLVGEGIAHSGFGGAGTAWLIAALVPSFADKPWLTYTAVVIFCIVTALLIGWLGRDERVYPDAAVGIFLVASLAWGFVGREVYHAKRGSFPPDFDNLLFGQITQFSTGYSLTVLCMSLAVIAVVWLMNKEIISYTFDPLASRISGVNTTLVYNLMMILIAIVIIISVRVVGTVLATALLVLPGTTALLVSRNLRNVLMTSIATSVIAVLIGLIIYMRWPLFPLGPAIVLALVLEFAIAYALTKLKRPVVA
jgi:ABC-type Mn2+/Zn2+ transport system permease subunit